MRLLLLLLFSFPLPSVSQTWKAGDDLLWTRYLNTWSISSRYTWVNELDNRVTTDLDRRAQTIFHSHLHRIVSPKQELVLGMSASHVQKKDGKSVLEIPELRLFEEWIYRFPIQKRHTLQSKIRVDQRFFLPSEAIDRGLLPEFQVRFRYQAQYRVQLPNHWAWRISNEWMAHAPATWVFDQNRVATSLEMPISPSVMVEGGYIWLLSQGNSQRISTDVFRLTLHHRIQKKGS